MKTPFPALALFAVVALTVTGSAQLLATGTVEVTLNGSISATPMVVAYHPGFDQYYASGGGFPTNDFVVYSATGTLLGTSTSVNTDNRSTWYNPTTGDIETSSYSACCSAAANAGHMQIPLDGAGLYSGPAVRLGSLPGLTGSQCVPAYNATDNRLYSRESSGTVNVVDLPGGAQSGTINLDFVAAGFPSLKDYSIGYTGVVGFEFAIAASDGSVVYVWDLAGAYQGSVPLPGISYGSGYDGNFANGHFFVYNGGGYTGFDIFVDGPTCAITAPAVGAMVGGTVTFVFNADDPQSDPVAISFEWSTDAGLTFGSATAAVGSPTSNPDFGITTPLVGGEFWWDSLTSGVGLVSPASVQFRISCTDGLTTGQCSKTITLDNTAPPPTCMPTIPASGSGVMTLLLDLASPNSPTVTVVIDFSTDGGTTFQMATMIPASPNPNPAVMITTGTQAWCWDTRGDGIGLLAPAPGVIVRATVTDGVALSPGTCTDITDIDNTSLCGGICGDCNLNGLGPDIVDALAAAQISAGLVIPSLAQIGCCDVNGSTVVDIVDSLQIAQSAAGLPVALMCL